MEDEDFLDLSLDSREDKLTIFASEMAAMGDMNFAAQGSIQNLAGVLGPGVTSDQFNAATQWANTSKRNRYDKGQELNSMFPELFPELEGLQFPTFELNEGSVDVANQDKDPDIAQGKWGKIQSAIDEGTNMYANQEMDGIISDPGLLPEGTDESIKKNLIQYGQVMKLTDPAYEKKYTQGPNQKSPFVDPKQAYLFTKQARNFQGTKFKVNALRYIAQNYNKDLHSYVDRNEDFFKYMPELREDEQFMEMYKSHEDIASAYHTHMKDNFSEMYAQDGRDILQTMRLSGKMGMGGFGSPVPGYLDTSIAVGVGGLVEGFGNLLGGVVEFGGKYGKYLNPLGGTIAAAEIINESFLMSDEQKAAKKELDDVYDRKVEDVSDSVSHFFSSDNWKDTAIGQYANIPNEVAGADLSENPMYILPMTLKTVGEMAPAIVAAAYSGGGTLVAGGIMGGDQFFKSYHQTNKEARELGVDPEDAEAMALSIGLVTGGTSAIFNNPLARRGAAAMMGIRNKATNEAVKTLATTGSRQAAIKAGTKAYLKEVGGEEIEELVQGGFENYQKYKYDQSTPNPVYGVDKFMSSTEFTNTLILTATATTLMASPNMAVSSTQLEKEAWTTAALDYENFEKSIQKELNKKNPKFSKETAAGMLEKAKVYEGIVKNLKDSGTKINDIVELADVEYNAMNTTNNAEPEVAQGNTSEPTVEEKKQDIKDGIPKRGSIVDGSKVVSIIENIGDSSKDIELKSKLDNIQGRSFKMKRTELETLYETNKEFKQFVDENPDMEYDGKNKNAPAVIDNEGNVLDGMKRLAAAYNRGQKGIRVFTENEVKLSKEKESAAKARYDEIMSPPVTENPEIENIQKLGEHFQRVFKGSTISFDQSEFDAVAKEAGEDPNITKGLRNRNNNQIYINPRNATLDTPIHEFAHIWEDMLAEINPDAHKTAMNLIKGTKFHKEAIAKGYGDRSLNEALVQAIGEKSAKIFKDPKRQSQFEKVIEQVKDIIRKALDLPVGADFDIKTSSIDEVINSSAEKIMSATNIQSPKSLSPSKPQGIDMDAHRMKPYKKAEREAIAEFDNLKELLKNDPTLAEINTVKDKSGRIKFEKQGKKTKVKIAKESYNMVNGLEEYFEGTLKDKVNQIGDKIVDEYNANSTVEEVVKGMGWYKDLHTKMRNIFGGRTNFFGRLIGATSAQTDVRNNYKYALGALKGYSKGAYDSYVEDYKDFIDRVEQFENEEELTQFFNEYKGRAINTAKNLGQSTKIFNVDPDPKDIEATKRKLLNLWPKANVLYRTDNPSLRYGINSPATAKVLAGIWLKQTQKTKTNNFYKNVVGLTTNPTIDVWAARTIRRMIYDGNIDRYRIPERAENGVSEEILVNSGNISDYRLAEEVIINASEKLGMDPDDLQAYLWFAEKDLWLKKGWSKGSAAKKGDFRDESSKNEITRYYLGLSTERKNYKNPVLENQDKLEMLKAEGVSIEEDLREQDLISLKVNTTRSQYLDDPERSFDAEMIVDSNQDMTPVLKRALESAKKHEQESVFLSEVLPIDERMDPETMERELAKKPNARPAVELQFVNPLSFDEATKFAQDNIEKEGVQIGPVKTTISSYTIITNESGDKAIGLKYQFVPEFVFENEEDITEENLNQATVDWVNNAQETKLNLENNENVLYFYNHYVDSFVAHNNQYNEILNNIKNGSKDIFKGTSKTRTKEYFQSKGRSELESETSSGFDAQRNEDGGDRPRFSGTLQTDDGGSISQVAHRRIDTQSLPNKLTQLLSALSKDGFTPSELIPVIQMYSQRTDGKEISIKDARLLLNEYMGSQGFRQRGFETNSIEKSASENKELYDWVNQNPNYYRTMNIQETMEFVIDEIENRGGFDDATVIKDLIKGNTTVEESARVQLARMAALKHYGKKISDFRSEGGSDADIDAALSVMSDIEKALASEATDAGRAIAALRSWTSQTPESLIDRLEIEMEKYNESLENPGKFKSFANKIFGTGTPLESTVLTDEQREKITSLHEVLSNAPENSEIANAAMRSMYRYVDSIANISTWQDTFWGLQYAALLSGASTQILNIGSGSANIILQPLMEMSRFDKIFKGGYLDFLRKTGKGTIKLGLEQGSAMFLDIWQNGSRVDKYSSDSQESINNRVKPGSYNTLETKEFRKFMVGGKDFNIFNKYKMVGRLLNATDRFISKVGYEGRYYNYLVDQLRKDGLSSKEISERASDLYLTTKVKQTALDEADELMAKLKKLDPDTNWDNVSKVRRRELMHEALVQRYSEEFIDKSDAELTDMMKSNDPELHSRMLDNKFSLDEYKDFLKSVKIDDINGVSEDANKASNSQVFIDDRVGMAHPISGVANFIKRYANKTYESEVADTLNKLVIKSFVPFTNIIGSIGEYLIDTTPGIGMARAYKAKDGLGDKGTRMREEQLSRAYFGTMSFLGLASLVAAAYNDDEDDPFIEVSGGGYNNPNQYTRSQMKNAPLPPYSVKLGGEVFDYRNIVPLAIPLAIIGNYMETFKTTGGKGEIFDDMTNRTIIALANSSNLLMDSSVMTSVNEFLESTIGSLTGMKSGLTYDGGQVGITPVQKRSDAALTNMVRSIGGTVMRVLPQNANLVRQATKIYDANSYSAGDVKNALIYASGLYQIPGVGQPKIDVFGEEAKSYPGETVIPYTHWFELRGKDPRWAFIDKYNAYPGKIRNNPIRIGGEMRALEPEEYYQHQKTTGIEFNLMLQDYMDTVGDSEDTVLLKRGKSASMRRKTILKLYTIAQNRSRGMNMSKWIQNERNK